MSFTIGIDVGGTFTDIVVSRIGGKTIIAKAATTPADQSDGVLEGIALAAERLGLTAADLLRGTSRIVHGTTVATNALLQGQGRARRHADDQGSPRRHRDARGPEAGSLQSTHDSARPAGAAALARAGDGAHASGRVGGNPARYGVTRQLPSMICAKPTSRRSRSASCTPGAIPHTSNRPPRRSAPGCRGPT